MRAALRPGFSPQGLEVVEQRAEIPEIPVGRVQSGHEGAGGFLARQNRGSFENDFLTLGVQEDGFGGGFADDEAG